MLVLTINTMSAQKPQQFRRIYSQIAVVENSVVSREDAQNTIFFNYGDEGVIKIYMADGSVRYFDQTTERDYGSTHGGMLFNGSDYKDRGSGLVVFVQLFEDRKYGVRFIFENGNMIQFLE